MLRASSSVEFLPQTHRKGLPHGIGERRIILKGGCGSLVGRAA